MPDALIARDARTGQTRKLVRVGHVDQMPNGGRGIEDLDEDDILVGALDRSGAIIKVEHTLDPEAQETLRSLRRGAPVAAAIGGAVAGAALFGLALWLLSEDGEEAADDETDEEEEEE